MGFVVGLTAEARIAARFGGLVEAGGGTPAGAGVAATRLIVAGATALISFGLAGGLDPALRSGSIVVPTDVLSDGLRLPVDAALAARFGGLTGHTILAGHDVVSRASDKAALFATTGAHAVDLESGPVAHIARAYGMPFAVVRAICDPAGRSLPNAALIALDPEGAIGFGAVVRSVLAEPWQIPGLLMVGRDAALARRALVHTVDRFQAEARTSNR